MSFNFMAWFAIGLGVYLIGLLIFAIIKRIKNGKKIKKEDKEHQEVIVDEKEEDNK